MSIISATDFTGQINIANTDQPGVSENLQGFIDKYEHKFLRLLLGKNFGNEFIAALLLDPVPENWLRLKNNSDLKGAIANYVFMFWSANEVSNPSGVGEVKAKSENSSPVKPTQKMVRAWNEMVGYNFEVGYWLNENSGIFPTWPMSGSLTWELEGHVMGFNAIRDEIFFYKNSFGL